MLSYDLLSEQLCDHGKLSQHLLLSLMMTTRGTNTASTRLTVYTEAADEAEDEASVNIEAAEEAHTGEISDIEETREQDFSKRSVMSTTSQAVGLLSILLKNKRRYIRSSVNILYIY